MARDEASLLRQAVGRGGGAVQRWRSCVPSGVVATSLGGGRRTPLAPVWTPAGVALSGSLEEAVPLTVAQVVALPDLGLLVRTTSPALDREVRWVAVSEHADPTPWIEAGDLLLTTGMSIGRRPGGGRAYVDRLMAADVAGLGFGVGFRHDVVPSPSSPLPTEPACPCSRCPSRCPSSRSARRSRGCSPTEEYADSAASFECQRSLIRAALAERGRAATGGGRRTRPGQRGVRPGEACRGASSCT